MAEREKTDWSFTESLARVPKAESKSLAADLSDSAGTEKTAGSLARIPAIDDSSSILVKYRAKKVGRKATLEALERSYAGQLDVLTHQISSAVQVKKTQIDVQAEEFLRELDARHLELLTEIGLRNKDTREKALIELTERTVEKLRDVQSRDWPPSLIEETVQDLFELRKRLVREVMEELGREHSNE